MSAARANALLSILVAIGSLMMNFLVFTFSYNRLATPFLHEEQRVENADYIMTVTLSSFGIVAIVIGVAVYLMLRKKTATGREKS